MNELCTIWPSEEPETVQTVETDRETEREEMAGMEGDIKGPLVTGLSPGEEITQPKSPFSTICFLLVSLSESKENVF